MTWAKARDCCALSGMILHTPERADDGEQGLLAKALENFDEMFESSEAPFWTSGHAVRNHRGRHHFVWHFNTTAGESSQMYERYMREKHWWIEESPKQELLDSYCLAIQQTFDVNLFE